MKFKFKKVTIQINIEIKPEFLSNPNIAITKYMESFLMRHTVTLEGIPMTFNILEVATKGIIDNKTMNVYLPAKVDLLVMCVNLGDTVECSDGLCMGLFNCKVEDDTNYTGDIKIISFYEENGLLKVIGEKFN